MSIRPVSEKAAEILFSRFMLQAFPLGQIELFAPSSVEEFVMGYDAKLVGRGFFKELYLQFKAPTYSERHDRFTIRPTAHQHRLLKEYPPNSAFYVVGMFRSLHELNTHQTGLQRAADFLVNFVCIEVSGLPEAVDFFHFSRPPTNRQSPNIAFKVPADGSTRTATHAVIGRGWLRGSALLEQFRTGTLGASVLLDDASTSERKFEDQVAHFRGDIAESVWHPAQSRLFELSSDCTASDFGIHLRRQCP